MDYTRRFIVLGLGVALATPVGLGATDAIAETPATTLVIATEIDDITSLDPQESFEFSGSDILNNIYGSLVSFDPNDLSTTPPGTVARDEKAIGRCRGKGGNQPGSLGPVRPPRTTPNSGHPHRQPVISFPG